MKGIPRVLAMGWNRKDNVAEMLYYPFCFIGKFVL